MFILSSIYNIINQYLIFFILQFIIVYGLVGYEPLSYEDYVYPVWANVLGWLIACSSIIMIPSMAIYKLCTTPGSFVQVCILKKKRFDIVYCTRNNLHVCSIG